MSTQIKTKCDNCHKSFIRPARRYNESIKNNWKQFCCPQCRYNYRLNGQNLSCSNPNCHNVIYRRKSAINNNNNYCSHRCAAILTNHSRPSLKAIRNKCANPRCDHLVTGLGDQCCSQKCRYILYRLQHGHTRSGIISALKNFYIQYQRIPLKYELGHFYHPARHLFGTWNKAIIASGLDPNPVMFAHHHLARDGHKCDSLAEKILDDWLSSRRIPHERHVPYPWNNGMSSDFKVNDYWIELFGLEGEHLKYDQLKAKKLKLIQRFNLKHISLSLKDVYSPQSLTAKLRPILPS